MLADDAKTRLEASIESLANRVQHALDLSELVRQGALPNSLASAFIVPAGLRPQQGGESASGAYTQEVDEVIAVVLVINSAADVTGGRAAPRVDVLVWQVIYALVGWGPADTQDSPYIGVFRFLRGQVVSLTKGAVIYQVEFAIPLQLRVLS